MTERLERVQRIVDAIVSLARQRWCGLKGHDYFRRVDNDERRIFEACLNCQHERRGWRLDAKAPRLRFAGDPKRHAIRRARMVRRSA